MRYDLLGLGPFRRAILETIRDASGEERRTVKSSRMIEALERATGAAPGVLWEEVLWLARDWCSNVPLLHPKGNFGSQDDPPANPRYTEVSVSDAGYVALDAEDRDGVQLPIGLIEGSLTRGGRRPAYAPRGVVGAVRRAVLEPSAADEDLVALVGAPRFATGCLVEVDEVASAAGEPTDLVLTADLLVEYGGPETVVTLFRDRMPPGEGIHEVVTAIIERRTGGWSGPDARQKASAERELLQQLRDVHEGPGHSMRFVYRDVDDIGMLQEVFHHTEGVQQHHFKTVLPAPLADLVRLAADQPADPLLAALDAFETALPERRP